jgi:hypothetical protein
MTKKTARTTKPSQQRSKEEQWRRRMAAQARTGMAVPGTSASSAVADVDDEILGDTGTMADGSTSAATARTSTANSRTQSTQAATQRRIAAQARTSRTRLATNTLSLEDEMYYVRSDIRRLVILSGVCLAILIGLALILPLVM